MSDETLDAAKRDPSHVGVEHWLRNDDVTLFAVEYGAGEPVIVLHGALGNHLAALAVVAPLASRYRLIIPDLRGSGRSIDASRLSWDRLADDVAAWLDHFGLQCAVVGGVSSGSAVALRFALLYPTRTLSLLLVTPVYAGAERGLTDPQREAFSRMGEFGERTVGQGIEALLPLYDELPSPMRERAKAMAAGFDPGSVAATTRFVASGEQPFVGADDLRSIDASTLLLPGNDALHPPEVSRLYAENLASCEVREAAGEAAVALGEFLDRTREGRARER